MDFRERLEFMGKAPGMFAITREGFVMQTMVLLEVLGLDAKPLMRIGVPQNSPSCTVPVEMWALDMREEASGLWAQEVIKAALAMLPEGSAEYVFVHPPQAI